MKWLVAWIEGDKKWLAVEIKKRSNHHPAWYLAEANSKEELDKILASPDFHIKLRVLGYRTPSSNA